MTETKGFLTAYNNLSEAFKGLIKCVECNSLDTYCKNCTLFYLDFFEISTDGLFSQNPVDEPGPSADAVDFNNNPEPEISQPKKGLRGEDDSKQSSMRIKRRQNYLIENSDILVSNFKSVEQILKEGPLKNQISTDVF